MSGGKWPFYVSYSWGTENQIPLVEKLKEDVKKFPSLKLVLDTERCKPGDSIQAFLNEVGKAPRLLLILSEPYFSSKYTLTEFAVALKQGGLNTRVRVVLVDGFRLDYYLRDNLQNIQKVLNENNIDLCLDDYTAEIECLSDSLVSIGNAKEDTNFTPVIQNIQESYQQYTNPDIDDAEKLYNIRSIELIHLKKKINALIDNTEELKPLAEALRKNAADAGVAGRVADLICSLDVGDAQQQLYETVLYPALCDVLETSRSRKSVTQELLDQSIQLVGWVATTYVNDLWVQQNGAALSDFTSPSTITIGLENGHLIELIVARVHMRSAELKKCGKANFESKLGVLFHEPEAVNPLMLIFQKLMVQFMPDEDCNEMTDKNWEKLEARIRLKRRRENIFVAFYFPNQWGNVNAELERKLQCLPRFWLQDSDNSACLLLMSEPKVDAFLAESINLIEGYRQYVK